VVAGSRKRNSALEGNQFDWGKRPPERKVMPSGDCRTEEKLKCEKNDDVNVEPGGTCEGGDTKSRGSLDEDNSGARARVTCSKHRELTVLGYRFNRCAVATNPCPKKGGLKDAAEAVTEKPDQRKNSGASQVKEICVGKAKQPDAVGNLE